MNTAIFVQKMPAEQRKRYNRRLSACCPLDNNLPKQLLVAACAFTRAQWRRRRSDEPWVAERLAHLGFIELRAGRWDMAERRRCASE